MLKNKRYFALAGAAAVVAGGAAFAAMPASASTHACDLTNPTLSDLGCGSWNAEVPGLPDLDVRGRAAVSGNVLIVYPRSATDPAEDFVVQVVPAGTTTSFTGTGPATLPAAPAGQANVRIQYAPRGVLSGFCVSSVNPNGFASAQIRHCDSTPSTNAPSTITYNPYQTFIRHDTGNPGDGQFVTYEEVVNHHLLTDPKNDGSVGVPGARVQVKFAGGGLSTIRTGQLWGFNGN